MNGKKRSREGVTKLHEAWKRMHLHDSANLDQQKKQEMASAFEDWQKALSPSKSEINRLAQEQYTELHQLKCEQEISNLPQKLTTVWKKLGLHSPFPSNLSDLQQEVRAQALIHFEEWQTNHIVVSDSTWVNAIDTWRTVCQEARNWHRQCRAALVSAHGPCLVRLSDLRQMTRLLHEPTISTESDLPGLMSRFSVPKDSDSEAYNFTSMAGGRFMIPESEWIHVAAECKLHSEQGKPVVRLNQQFKNLDTSRFVIDFDIRRPLPLHKSFTSREAIRQNVPFVSIFTRDNVARRSILEVMAATVKRYVLRPTADPVDEAVVLCASGPIATFDGEYVTPPTVPTSPPENWPATSKLEAKDSFCVVFPGLVLKCEESTCLAVAIRVDLEKHFLHFGQAPDLQIYTRASQRRLLYSDKKAIEVCAVHWESGKLLLRCNRCGDPCDSLSVGCLRCKENGDVRLSCKKCKWKGHQWRPLRFVAWFRSILASAQENPRAIVLRPDPAIEWTDAFDKSLRRAAPGTPPSSLIGALAVSSSSAGPERKQGGQTRSAFPAIHNCVFRFFPESWEPEILKTRDMQSIAATMDFKNPCRVKLDQDRRSAMAVAFEAVNHVVKNYLGPSCLCSDVRLFWTDKGVPMYQMGMMQNVQHFSCCPHKLRLRQYAMARLMTEAHKRNITLKELCESTKIPEIQDWVKEASALARHNTNRIIVTLTPHVMRFKCLDKECTERAKKLLNDKFDSFEVKLPQALQQMLFVTKEQMCKIIDSGSRLARFLAFGATPLIDRIMDTPIQSVWR